MASGSNIGSLRLWLGLATGLCAASAACGAEPAPPFQFNAEGSFPLQYIESVSRNTRQHTLNAAPYLGLKGTAQIAPDLTASAFADGGHGQLGSFRDNDDTFLSAGGNLVKAWGAFSTGISLEHTHYYDGTFGRTSNIANEINLFANYLWRPNADLRIRPSMTATVRADEHFAVERYSYSLRVHFEQRLVDRLWLVVTPRVRYLDYVAADAGRRDVRAAIVGGFRYDFSKEVSGRLLAGYENRQSNAAGRNSDKYSIGASLDFEVDFIRPRGER